MDLILLMYPYYGCSLNRNMEVIIQWVQGNENSVCKIFNKDMQLLLLSI